MPRHVILQRLAIGAGVATLVGLLIAGCSDSGVKDPTTPGMEDPDAGGGSGIVGGGGSMTDVTIDPCDIAQDPAGCPCSEEEEGNERDCRVYRKINEGQPDEVISCTIGKNTCEGGEWSECSAERTIALRPEDVPQGTVFHEGDAG